MEVHYVICSKGPLKRKKKDLGQNTVPLMPHSAHYNLTSGLRALRGAQCAFHNSVNSTRQNRDGAFYKGIYIHRAHFEHLVPAGGLHIRLQLHLADVTTHTVLVNALVCQRQ